MIANMDNTIIFAGLGGTLDGVDTFK